VPEDYGKESHVYASVDPPGVIEAYTESSCQRWPNDEVEDGFWFDGQITSLITIILGILAVVRLWFFMTVKRSLI
jgi:hypothetical protein